MTDGEIIDHMNFLMMAAHDTITSSITSMVWMLAKHPELLNDKTGGNIERIEIAAYEPAFGIIGNPAKMNPTTRQSADHSMAYIVATLIRKALHLRQTAGGIDASGGAHDMMWKTLMLSPYDYKVDDTAIFNPLTRSLMNKIRFRHGGAEYDSKYPDGIPTSVDITDTGGNLFRSGFIMYPAGHARNTNADLANILHHKFHMLGRIAMEKPEQAITRLSNLSAKSAEDIQGLYTLPFIERGRFE